MGAKGAQRKFGVGLGLGFGLGCASHGQREGKGRLGEPVMNEYVALGACTPRGMYPPPPPQRASGQQLACEVLRVIPEGSAPMWSHLSSGSQLIADRGTLDGGLIQGPFKQDDAHMQVTRTFLQCARQMSRTVSHVRDASRVDVCVAAGTPRYVVSLCVGPQIPIETPTSSLSRPFTSSRR